MSWRGLRRWLIRWVLTLTSVLRATPTDAPHVWHSPAPANPAHSPAFSPPPQSPPRPLGRNHVLGRQTLVLDSETYREGEESGGIGAETYLEREEPGEPAATKTVRRSVQR